MCSCNAFYYKSCRKAHVKFVQVSTCFSVRIGWKTYCPCRILNGDTEQTRTFPVVDEQCPQCAARKAEKAESPLRKRTRRENVDLLRYASTYRQFMCGAIKYELRCLFSYFCHCFCSCFELKRKTYITKGKIPPP
ncbi:hypothetical protein F4810DRAFT_657322 [Camillea tinctor]|nr:hypothetical protein F4810DRAFT_657322 [Camillea tinctor]